jgi:hypothetical protein
VSNEEGQKGVLECNEALSLAVINAPITEPKMAITPTAPIAASAAKNLPTQSESATTRLKALNALYKDGVINQQDYETKKQEILKSM